jgi:hypothetical protein
MVPLPVVAGYDRARGARVSKRLKESSMIYVMVAVILAVLGIPYMIAVFADDHHSRSSR